MNKYLQPFRWFIWTTGLVFGIGLAGSVPVAGQQNMVRQPISRPTAEQMLSTPVRVSFDRPVTGYPIPGGEARPAVSKSNKMRFAFSTQLKTQPTNLQSHAQAPVGLHPNQIASQRRRAAKAGKSVNRTASIPYRSPVLATTPPVQVPQPRGNSTQAPSVQPYMQAPQATLVQTPQVLAHAMASGQYDGYLVVSDQEYMLMKQGQASKIDPNRVRPFVRNENAGLRAEAVSTVENKTNSPVSEYGNMLDRMEFSLAKLPGAPRALPLPPPSSAAVWNRFLTGRQSDEIRSWKNNYVELAQHRALAPSRQRSEGGPASPDTMLANNSSKPVEMKRLKTDLTDGKQEDIRLVSGEVTRDMLPEFHTPQPLRMENTEEESARTIEATSPVPDGKMKVYRPQD